MARHKWEKYGNYTQKCKLCGCIKNTKSLTPEYRMTGYISQYGKAPDCPGANDSIFIEYNETEECIIDVAKTINLWDANWFISQWHDQYTLVKGDKEVKASISKRQAKELIVELDLMPEQSPVFRNGKTWKNQKENKQ